jgi:hypothetical protein
VAEAAAERGDAGVLLAWARDRDGRKVHAAALDPRDRRGRAPFTCLGCGEPLVARLGKIRARHFAHAPGSECPLTAPETALHLDAKERLLALCAEAFAGRRRVTLLARCPRCRGRAPLDLGAAGDSALAEGAVGPLRADVLVTAGGRPALALEVKVTHAVDGAKEAALAGCGVPAVEVDAREAWQEESAGGTAIRCARSLGFAPCPACATAARAEVERDLGGEAAEIAALEAYRARGLFGTARHGGSVEQGSPAKSPSPSARTGSPSAEGIGPPSPPARTRSRSAEGPGPPSPPARTGSPSAEGIGPPSPSAGGGGRGSGRGGQHAGDLSESERTDLLARFHCPDCGGRQIQLGERLARHACPDGTDRPVAWRGYDDTLVEMGWWRR